MLRFSVATAAESNEDICIRNMQSPEIVITTSYGELHYDHTKNKRSITRLHVSKNKAKLKSGQLLNGLSTYKVGAKFNLEARQQSLESGLTCVYTRKVDLFLGVTENPVTYIAKEFEEDSCPYNVTLRHEETHQQINQIILEHYVNLLRKKVTNFVTSNVVVFEDDNVNMLVAKEKLHEKLSTLVDKHLEELYMEFESEQSKLDMSINYNYENELCEDE